MIENLISEFGLATLLIIALIALVTSTIHGATGVAGGLLLAAALSPFIGVKPLVPIMSIALLISHSSRALFNMRDFDKRAFLLVASIALPCVVAAAFLYGRMTSQWIAIILAFVILISIPARRWAKKRDVKAGKFTLGLASAVYGSLSGLAVGPGMFLAPFLLGFGLAKEAFVATLATVALLTNLTRISVYGFSDLITAKSILIGILIGLITIPGNWFGRKVLRSMTNERHANFVDVLIIIAAINFLWIAYSS